MDSPTERRSTFSNSPEFEFWMLRNPSFPEPNLLSADELFADGVLLPLHSLHLHSHPPPNSQPAEPGPPINPADSTTPLTSSKRWTDIFKKTPATKTQQQEKEKEKKRDKKSQSGGSSSSAELNINIWPFSRSRSAGNSGTRTKLFPGGATTRKVTSAPCSRSNSAGESKFRKWPSSPCRSAVHRGRSSPVRQVRRGAGGSATKSSIYSEAVNLSSEHGKNKVVNLNVPNMCIGYRQNLSCRNGSTGVSRNGSTNNSTANLLNLRSLFSKKVY